MQLQTCNTFRTATYVAQSFEYVVQLMHESNFHQATQSCTSEPADQARSFKSFAKNFKFRRSSPPMSLAQSALLAVGVPSFYRTPACHPPVRRSSPPQRCGMRSTASPCVEIFDPRLLSSLFTRCDYPGAPVAGPLENAGQDGDAPNIQRLSESPCFVHDWPVFTPHVQTNSG